MGSVASLGEDLIAQPLLGFYNPFGMLNGDVSEERFELLCDLAANTC